MLDDVAELIEHGPFNDDVPNSLRAKAAELRAALSEPDAVQEEPESLYWKAVRTGEYPAIWPPITMARDELEHFRATHGL